MDTKKEEVPKETKPNDCSWKEDIEKLDYYYDDSTGYETYVDDESEEDHLS
jgi:hypothetical protein